MSVCLQGQQFVDIHVLGSHMTIIKRHSEIHMYPRDLRRKDSSAGAALKVNELAEV